MKKGDEFKRIGAKVESVKTLQFLGLLQKFTPEPIVYVYRQVLQMEDHTYMKNWCANVWSVWALTFPHLLEDGLKEVELTVFDKETGDLLCRYINGEVVIS